jgi:hypothetical protein
MTPGAPATLLTLYSGEVPGAPAPGWLGLDPGQ